MSRAVFGFLLGCVVAGCHPTVMSGGIEVYEHVWRRTDQELRYRAAMTLQCDAPSVALTLMQRQGKIPTVVHAAGCGRQAVFSRQLRRHHGKLTTANTTWTVEGMTSIAQARHTPLISE